MTRLLPFLPVFAVALCFGLPAGAHDHATVVAELADAGDIHADHDPAHNGHDPAHHGHEHADHADADHEDHDHGDHGHEAHAEPDDAPVMPAELSGADRSDPEKIKAYNEQVHRFEEYQEQQAAKPATEAQSHEEHAHEDHAEHADHDGHDGHHGHEAHDHAEQKEHFRPLSGGSAEAKAEHAEHEADSDHDHTGHDHDAHADDAAHGDHDDDAHHAMLVTHALAVMRPTEGNTVHGVVWFEQLDATRVKVTADIAGLTPNAKHGFHIHEFGDVSSSDGTATGGHYNPDGHDHALPGDDAHRHAGDLGNLHADAEGNANFGLIVDNLTIAGTRSPVLGRGVIIHVQEDDGGQPIGNAGPRAAQGVIGVTKAPGTP